MRELTEFLSTKGLIFKKLEKIEPKELGVRKRVTIYSGVDLKSYHTVILTISQKSRFLTKDVLKVEEIFQKVIDFKEINCKKKILILTAPLCSKAKALMSEKKWKLFEDFNS